MGCSSGCTYATPSIPNYTFCFGDGELTAECSEFPPATNPPPTEPATESPTESPTEPATWSEWTDWGPCSTTCGWGLTERERQCSDTDTDGACRGEATQTDACQIKPCPSEYRAQFVVAKLPTNHLAPS